MLNKKTESSNNTRIDKIIVLVSILLATALNIVMLFKHELWADEAMSWLISRDVDLRDLFDVLGANGHPMLHYTLLMLLSRVLALPYKSCVVINIIIMSIVMIIIGYKAPFKSITKALFILSPFCLYFFADIARNYALCTLLVVIACIFYENRMKHPFRYTVVLALMVQCHTYLIGLAFACCLMLLIETIDKYRNDKNIRALLTNGFALLIPFLSAILLLFEFENVQDSTNGVVLGVPFSLTDYIIGFSVAITQLHGGVPFFTLCLIALVIGFMLFIDSKPDKKAGIIIYIISIVAFFVVCSITVSVNYCTFLIPYLFIFFLWTQYRYIKKPSSYWMFAYLVITIISAWYAQGWVLTNDFVNSYSDSEKTAYYINSLPDDAVISMTREYPFHSIVPFLDEDTYLINPLNFKKMSYYDLVDKEKDITVTPDRVVDTIFGYTDKDDIYIVYELDIDDPVAVAASHEYEIVYTTTDHVFISIANSPEKYGIMHIYR